MCVQPSDKLDTSSAVAGAGPLAAEVVTAKANAKGKDKK
jgi:hypothetical protein